MLSVVCICSTSVDDDFSTAFNNLKNSRFPVNIDTAHTQTRQKHILQMQGNHGRSQRTDFSSWHRLFLALHLKFAHFVNSIICKVT